MGFIPEITCRHCGQKYSALHLRCPHCGTRHVKQSTRSAATTASAVSGSEANKRLNSNTQWQFIFGCILVAAVIVAVIVLITASLKPNEPVTPVDPSPLPTVVVTTPPPPTPSPTPTPIPVTSVSITFLGDAIQEFTQRTTWAPIDLDAEVYPLEALTENTVTWRSSDEAVCTVDQDGVVTGVGSGRCEIIAECGGVAASVKVLVP